MPDIQERIIKRAPPPAELPPLTPENLPEVTFFGTSNFVAPMQSIRKPVGLKRVDRRRHLYLIGKSGMGKSKLLELLIRPDVFYGHGVGLIDPHGDLVTNILDFVPKERINDIILVDAGDANFPVSFNPLKNVSEDYKHHVTQGLVEIFEKQFAASWTSRLEHVFRFTCLALLDYPDATMYGMLKLLTDREYRQKVISHIGDDVVKRFWAIEFASWSEKFDTEAIVPLVSRLGQFLSNPLIRNIFGQKANKIDFDEIMAQKKMIFMNISKGKIGDENAELFGSIFVTKIQQAAMARSWVPEEQRHPFYFYVDEFQNVATQSFLNLFSESRKYGMNLTVAHQYLGQLTKEMQDTVFGNVASIISYRVSGEDARRVSSEFAPVFDANDLINLGMQEIYVKMSIDGRTYDPFSADVMTVKPPNHPSYRDEIVEQSHRMYSKTKAEVVREISELEAITPSSAKSAEEEDFTSPPV